MTWDETDRVQARERLVELTSRLPGTEAEDSHGHTGFLLRGKRFAWLLADHHGDGRLALWVKAPPGEQQGLAAGDPERYFVPAYVGSKGWVGVDLAADPDWDEIDGLLGQAWRMGATKRALAEFEG